jgi:hypothetical protein
MSLFGLGAGGLSGFAVQSEYQRARAMQSLRIAFSYLSTVAHDPDAEPADREAAAKAAEHAKLSYLTLKPDAREGRYLKR